MKKRGVVLIMGKINKDLAVTNMDGYVTITQRCFGEIDQVKITEEEFEKIKKEISKESLLTRILK
jgi:hypothetical protein